MLCRYLRYPLEKINTPALTGGEDNYKDGEGGGGAGAEEGIFFVQSFLI